MKLAMVNGKFVSIENLDPIFYDRGLYFGDGVYEVLRSYHGKLFALDEHMERFAASMAAIRITGIDIRDIRARVECAFKMTNLPNVKIYFHVTRGSAPRNHVWDPRLKPNFLLIVSEVKDHPEEKARGVAVCTHPDLRWKRCDIKSLNLLPNVLARQYAFEKSCDEAILVNEAGYITEGTSSAFFGIARGALQTAPLSANILPSITRKFVVKAATNVGMPIEECSLTPKQATAADELFLAVTTRDIIPVVKFDDATIGNGTPGPLTKALTAEFLKFTH